MPPTTPFMVLTVCTGNVCRSPAAELWLQAYLGPEGTSGVRVHSAGVRAVIGAGVCPEMARLVEFTGVATAGFAARYLAEPLIVQADLVLALSRGHRSVVVERVPAALRRTFTLREFARLVRAVDPAEVTTALGGEAAAAAASPAQRLAALVPLAAARRWRTRVTPDDDDVVDPIGQPTEVVEEAADLIWAASQTIARAARGESRRTRGYPVNGAR